MGIMCVAREQSGEGIPLHNFREPEYLFVFMNIKIELFTEPK